MLHTTGTSPWHTHSLTRTDHEDQPSLNHRHIPKLVLLYNQCRTQMGFDVIRYYSVPLSYWEEKYCMLEVLDCNLCTSYLRELVPSELNKSLTRFILKLKCHKMSYGLYFTLHVGCCVAVFQSGHVCRIPASCHWAFFFYILAETSLKIKPQWCATRLILW